MKSDIPETLRNLLHSKLLTREEAGERMKRWKTIITHSDQNCYFFSDSHMHSYIGGLEGFVPRTTGIPLTVAPREGFESGVIQSVEDYEKVFMKNLRYISSEEELKQYTESVSGAKKEVK